MNELYEIHRVACSKNYSYKYKAHRTLYFRIPLTEEARHLLAYSYSYQSDLFFLWTGTIFDRLKEPGNLPDEIASLTQEVKYSQVIPVSFKILI